MKVFEPLRTYSSPRRSAVVFSRATSEPASGLERPNEQRIGSSRSGGSHVAFCSSLPAMITGPAPRPFAPSEVPMPVQPQFSSSPTSMPSNAPRPRPPYSTGMCRFISPSPCAFAITSAGCCIATSYSAALGRISFAANSRASARNSFCSSVRANETPPWTASSIVAIVSSRVLIDWSVNKRSERRRLGQEHGRDAPERKRRASEQCRLLPSAPTARNLRMVDDRLGVAVHAAEAPGLVDLPRLQVRELGHVATNVVTARIAALGLQRRVEHASTLRVVDTRPGDPLPVAAVRRDIPVEQQLLEPRGTVTPVDTEILDEEGRRDESRAVVHPPLARELAHARVDERVAGATLPPRVEGGAGVASAIGPVVQVGARRLGERAQELCVEVSPAHLADPFAALPRRSRAPDALERGETAEVEIGAEARRV